jgi:hypothetical protein
MRLEARNIVLLYGSYDANAACPAGLGKHGVLSELPDVSSDEARAERRIRYSEMRWSLDTSSRD